jgi:dephospho-CoA kinase
MIILGLTGSVGMGKSSASRVLHRIGVPVHDADAAVHHTLTKDNAAIARIAAAFPEAVSPEGIDRRRLAALALYDAQAHRFLEAILHPSVWSSVRRFLMHQARLRRSVVALDVPLLFETGAELLCDAVINVSAPPFIQRSRVLRRPGFDQAKLQAVLSKQLPDSQKRRRADFVVPTGLGHRNTLRVALAIVRLVRPNKRYCRSVKM